MSKTWIDGINKALIAAAVLFFLLAGGYQFSRPGKLGIPTPTQVKKVLPRGSFTWNKEVYDVIGPPLLDLQFSPMNLQLPDLRSVLVYYGKNQRPDADKEMALLHLAFTGSQEIYSQMAGKPIYLLYDKDQPRVKYRFSPGNQPTSLWIEISSRADKEAVVDVAMKNEAGEIIRKPEVYARFILKEVPYNRFGPDNRWEIGKWKVDGTILARQKARWYGTDLFLERHGGEEFKKLGGKQRVDFGDKEDSYSIYLKVGEGSPWIEGRWRQPEPGMDTRPYPLLVLNSVEERLIKFDLWDVEGKAKIALTLIKSAEMNAMRNLEKQFKFVGARTRSQLVFEINKERILISLKDWLLYLNGKWEKLETAEQIDQYVERKVQGPLFVVDDVHREDGKQVLIGALFNASRTEMQTIEIPLQQGAAPIVKIPEKKEEKGNSGESGQSIEEKKEAIPERFR